MMDTLLKYLGYAPAVLTAVIGLLAVIAPITKSDYDNKAMDALKWLEDKLVTLVLPSLAKSAPAQVAAKA